MSLVRFFALGVAVALASTSCDDPGTTAHGDLAGAEPAPAASRAARELDERRGRDHVAAPSVVVMSYNVNYRRPSAATIAAIQALGADVVFLQETTRRWERLLRPALRRRYPHMAFRHARGAGGLAVLSRWPFASRAFVPSPVGKFPAWLVELTTPLGPVRAMNLHLIPIVRGRRRALLTRYLRTQEIRLRETQRYLERLAALAGAARGLPTILLGDLNEDIDGRSLRLLQTRGFHSAAERFVPGAPTWRWNTRFGELRWQLDHILLDRHLRARYARVVEAGDSDHFPVIAILERSRRSGS